MRFTENTGFQLALLPVQGHQTRTQQLITRGTGRMTGTCEAWNMNDLEKPDLKNGVPLASVPDGGKLLGTVDGEEVLLVGRGTEWFAVGAHCTHYHGPLADGLVVDDEVRCPWHHACFSLRTGEALRAPALDPIACWRVEQEGESVFVKKKASASR